MMSRTDLPRKNERLRVLSPTESIFPTNGLRQRSRSNSMQIDRLVFSPPPRQAITPPLPTQHSRTPSPSSDGGSKIIRLRSDHSKSLSVRSRLKQLQSEAHSDMARLGYPSEKTQPLPHRRSTGFSPTLLANRRSFSARRASPSTSPPAIPRSPPALMLRQTSTPVFPSTPSMPSLAHKPRRPPQPVAGVGGTHPELLELRSRHLLEHRRLLDLQRHEEELLLQRQAFQEAALEIRLLGASPLPPSDSPPPPPDLPTSPIPNIRIPRHNGPGKDTDTGRAVAMMIEERAQKEDRLDKRIHNLRTNLSRLRSEESNTC